MKGNLMKGKMKGHFRKGKKGTVHELEFIPSYIYTFSSTMYTIRVNLFLIDWPSVVPCTMESGESLTDTHIRSPSDSALSHQRHQFEKTLLSLSTDMCGKICTGQSPGHKKYVYTVYTWPVLLMQ